MADLSIHFEDTVKVLEEMVGDGAGKGILYVGIDVHLRDTVIQGFMDFVEFRTRKMEGPRPIELSYFGRIP